MEPHVSHGGGFGRLSSREPVDSRSCLDSAMASAARCFEQARCLAITRARRRRESSRNTGRRPSTALPLSRSRGPQKVSRIRFYDTTPWFGGPLNGVELWFDAEDRLLWTALVME